MKKITAILVCLLLVASLAVTAFAAEAVQMTITPAKTSIKRGETIDFSISMTELANCKSAGGALDFDTNVFEFVEGECTVSGVFMSNFSADAFVFAFQKPATVSGEIYTFKLKVKDDAVFGKSVIGTKEAVANTSTEGATVTINTVTMDVVCDHKWDEGVVTTAATCEADGVKTFTCTVAGCGETKTEAVTKLGHKMDDGKVTTEPTCEADGVKTFTCENGCGKTTTEAIVKLGHKMDAGKVTTEPTCKTEGVKTFTCENGCGKTTTEAVAMLAHTEKTEVTKAATCAEEGEQVTTCTACGDTLKTEKIEMLEHTPGEYTETKAPTCYAEGEKTATCSVCGAAVTAKIEMLEHTWDEGVITTAATTKKEGVKTFTCTVEGCGATKTESVPKLSTPPMGDNSMIIPFVLLMVLSAAGVAVAVIGKKRVA